MSGISAQYVNGLEFRIKKLGEQVEKLTKERDIKEHCITQFKLEDLRMKEQLAALAAQNEKMRAFVTKISEQTPERPDYWSSCGQCEHNSSNAEDLLELPTLQLLC